MKKPDSIGLLYYSVRRITSHLCELRRTFFVPSLYFKSNRLVLPDDFIAKDFLNSNQFLADLINPYL
jgi:hypothetical protein